MKADPSPLERQAASKTVQRLPTSDSGSIAAVSRFPSHVRSSADSGGAADLAGLRICANRDLCIAANGNAIRSRRRPGQAVSVALWGRAFSGLEIDQQLEPGMARSSA